MRGNILEQGHYNLYQSTRAHRLLMLNENSWYRWSWDIPMQKLYFTNGVSEKSGDNQYELLRQGRFYIVHASQGEYEGFDHLLLENGNFFYIYRLPGHLPSLMETEVDIIDVKEKVPAEDVDSCFYHLSDS